ncbi:hypothetical protein TPB0596_23540 [Tsukamurella pulmonis]|uniref:hypothetical protein n=1 Tax=Tsukamurella pulmonis TaxID=47312 RepID=UPI001EE04AC9|nr:hypothetical protein [Tsukamurella pulmonis]BDD82591.1 hypothetical protein TPB0596_23540 [Tsukamurella pulmonis]
MTAAPAIRRPDAGAGPARLKVCSDKADEACVLTALTSIVDEDSQWLRKRMANDTSLASISTEHPRSVATSQDYRYLGATVV